jgi:hexosaminidase
VVEWAAVSQPVQAAIEDESYVLEVTPVRARLRAASALGVLRGLETLLQSVQLGPHTGYIPACVIRDQPRFAWRGLMLDCARQFMTIADLKRTLDGMAAVKLNVFHWHLTDDQGFRLESKVFPKLAAAGSAGLFYSQPEIREVIAYARERGIRVVPELDMPAHTTSWFVGYPELASAPGPYLIERSLGLFEPIMNPARPELYGFLDALFGEVATLFPDEYVHIGGDEIDFAQWKRNADIQQFVRDRGLADERYLHRYFNQRLEQILRKHGRKMIAWDDALNAGLETNVVVQSWHGTGPLAEAARSGHSAIFSFGYYLDQLQPARAHYLADPLAGETAGLTADERERILGGEACLWTEYVSAANLDMRLWPRAAAIAERFWSPREIRDADSMYQRLREVSLYLETAGLEHRIERRIALQRLAGSDSIAPLEVLLETLAPVRPDHRSGSLNRLVDAAEPDSEAARDFAQWSKDWRGRERQIRSLLERWRDNAAAVKPLLERSDSLQEAIPLAERVHSLCIAGLEVLAHLEQGRRASRRAVLAQRQLIQEAALPQADLVVNIIEPLRSLVDGAAKERAARPGDTAASGPGLPAHAR